MARKPSAAPAAASKSGASKSSKPACVREVEAGAATSIAEVWVKLKASLHVPNKRDMRLLVEGLREQRQHWIVHEKKKVEDRVNKIFDSTV